MLVAIQFLARDLAECGVNILLIALAWFGIYAWTRHRDWLGGASLGLAIARGFVEAHGGHIWAASEPGTGTTIGFTLPLADSA